MEKSPDIAVKKMVLQMEKVGCENTFDRFDQQKLHCSLGMVGVCCRNCNIGPCRITKKSPRVVPGADADFIITRNLLRWVAVGVAANGTGARGREIMLALKASAEGSLKLSILG